MFSGYFGNYLLNRGLLTLEQLKDALDLQNSVHLKLGVLAVNAGYMTPAQVYEIHQLQQKADKKFGELAIQSGYLDGEKLESLLATQKQGHLLLGQALVDRNYLSLEQLLEAFEAYKRDCRLSDKQFQALLQGDTDEIVKALVDLGDSPLGNVYSGYISLLVRNVVRFLGESPRLQDNPTLPDYSDKMLACQEIGGPFYMFTAMAAGRDTYLDIAGRYAGEKFVDDSELARASFGEFLNLHNGIFLVNMSNCGTELEMKPQEVHNGQVPTGLRGGRSISLHLSKGKFELILHGKGL
ncbi:hypothetical protein DCCM_3866 [Desulfocucumis palustris]|uniref:Chemotaxis protein CheX n=1 Tax=Desulfocucumis palustris TaxID=1898651 RepID=A0A2L2XKC6_9FIRM|nr:hypothetical protein [Desulfocucumis palustris]GBF34746.1 hypothetical protein DCCM_3866 [Desulfocucumis palustris]